MVILKARLSHSISDWRKEMKVLNHIGIGVTNMAEFVRLMIALGICEMKEDKSPKACKLEFAWGGILQLHQGENATGVKLAIELPAKVRDSVAFRRLLDEEHIAWKFRRADVIDFEICGIGFHTVPPADKSPIVEFNFEGKKYVVSMKVFGTNIIRLPDGRLLELDCWLHSPPPFPISSITVLDCPTAVLKP